MSSGNTIGRSGVEKNGTLTEAQLEILDVTQEECSEVIQAASKIKRCGPDFIPTVGYGPQITARQVFTKEIGDALLCIEEAAAAGLIDIELLHAHVEQKQARLRSWTFHMGSTPSRIKEFLP